MIELEGDCKELDDFDLLDVIPRNDIDCIPLFRNFKANVTDISWYKLATADDYFELHGITDIIASFSLRWMISQVGTEESPGYELWCCYPKANRIDRDVGHSLEAKKSRYSEDCFTLSSYVQERVSENDWIVESHDTLRNLSFAERLLTKAAEHGAGLEDVMKVVDWAIEDPFWSENIRSMNGLHKHFDKLRSKSAGKRPDAPRGGRATRAEILAEAQRKRAERQALKGETK